MSDGTGVNCPACDYEFDYMELPWTENEEVEVCPNCGDKICIVPEITVKHKVALTRDEIDFVEAI